MLQLILCKQYIESVGNGDHMFSII